MAENKRPITSIPIGQFKARCLTLMKEVNESREPLLVTKRGKPIVKVIPLETTPSSRRFGAMSDSVRYHADIVRPDKSDWNENG